MNKDHIKGFLCGTVSAALLCSAVAFGDSAEKTLTALYSNIRLVVNGATVTPTDANGNAVEPFIVDGTTYLPVRAVASALKQDVSWDGNTQTVYLGYQPSSAFARNSAVVATVADIPIYACEMNYMMYNNRAYALSLLEDSTIENPMQNGKVNGVTLAQHLADESLRYIAGMKLGAAAAQREGLDAGESIAETYNSFINSFGGATMYNTFLASVTMEDADMRSLIESETLNNLYLQTASGAVSDSAAIAYFEENYVYAAHILVEDEALAKDIIRQLDGGADFDALSKEHNTDSGQPSGGYVFTHGEMVRPFEEAAFAMADNTYSKEPVASTYGYHILYKHPITDASPTAYFPAIKTAIASSALMEQAGAVVKTESFDTYVAEYR